VVLGAAGLAARRRPYGSGRPEGCPRRCPLSHAVAAVPASGSDAATAAAGRLGPWPNSPSKGRAPKTGYARSKYGAADWARPRPRRLLDPGRRSLQRDLVKKTYKKSGPLAGWSRAGVSGGPVLRQGPDDLQSGAPVTSGLVQIRPCRRPDGTPWQERVASSFTPAQRLVFANRPAQSAGRQTTKLKPAEGRPSDRRELAGARQGLPVRLTVAGGKVRGEGEKYRLWVTARGEGRHRTDPQLVCPRPTEYPPA